tara:strand:- start:1133 stop:1420 length:288 start_codon:yes stop_codon:yes gene_type:complete
MIPITAAAMGINSKKFKEQAEKVKALDSKQTSDLGSTAIVNEPSNSNLEARVSVLESVSSAPAPMVDFQMNMGSKQLNTPTSFSQKDLASIYKFF